MLDLYIIKSVYSIYHSEVITLLKNLLNGTLSTSTLIRPQNYMHQQIEMQHTPLSLY